MIYELTHNEIVFNTQNYQFIIKFRMFTISVPSSGLVGVKQNNDILKSLAVSVNHLSYIYARMNCYGHGQYGHNLFKVNGMFIDLEMEIIIHKMFLNKCFPI